MCDSIVKPHSSFFVMKCASIESLQQCINSKEWAFRERDKPPQPQDLLSEAHKRGEVILIFSVNGQHGWHGFCRSEYREMLNNHSGDGDREILNNDSGGDGDKQKDEACSDYREVLNNDSCGDGRKQKDGACSDSSKIFTDSDLKCDVSNTTEGVKDRSWHRFPVSWIVNFQTFNQYSCLDFKHTEHLILPDGSSLNKTRNWQPLPQELGQQLCCLIQDHHSSLLREQEKRREELLNNQPESFFKEDIDSEEPRGTDTWNAVVSKVRKELGEVLLACPFGSQRYNCSTPESDLDIFIVYQAKTVDVLGLEPPKQTIKNSHQEAVDYSVLELHRYCELLVKGDAKCVETLFLSDSPVLMIKSEAWLRLCQHRHKLLTEQCYDKYMKEIHGTTGLKQFHRWRDSNPGTEELTNKLCKLGYILLRLLQNVRDMVKSTELAVYRAEGSTEKRELMAVRRGGYSYTQFMDLVNSYTKDIESNKGNLSTAVDVTKFTVQAWLLECRIQDLQIGSINKTASS